MNHSLAEMRHNIPTFLFTGVANRSLPPNLKWTDFECKTSDYVLHFFPTLPLTYFHIDISPNHPPMLILVLLVTFISAFFHQVLRAYREYILWKTYNQRGYRCIPILTSRSGNPAGLQQVALVPLPSYAACIANRKKRSNRIGITEWDVPSTNQKAPKKTPANQLSTDNAHTPSDVASGAQNLVASVETSAQAAAADLVAISSISKNTRVPAYCVRTRGGFVACTCSPYTLKTHGKPIVCTVWYFAYAIVAFLEACLAVVIVVSIATFNGWMGLAVVAGGALGHLLTHWQAVTVVEVKASQ